MNDTGWQDQPGDASTNEQIYAQLRRFADADALEFVLPTDPLGQQWIIGAGGRIIKLAGEGVKAQAMAFLAGMQAMAWATQSQMRQAQMGRPRPGQKGT